MTLQQFVRSESVLIVPLILGPAAAGPLVYAQFTSGVSLVEVYASVSDRHGEPLIGIELIEPVHGPGLLGKTQMEYTVRKLHFPRSGLPHPLPPSPLRWRGGTSLSGSPLRRNGEGSEEGVLGLPPAIAGRLTDPAQAVVYSGRLPMWRNW